MRGSNRFPVGENRFPRELGLAKVGRLADEDVLVEHETRLVREWLWTLLEQEHAALRHGGRAVLIDDFVEKLDLARRSSGPRGGGTRAFGGARAADRPA